MQNIEILFEDEDILVCYKSAGLAVQSSRVTEPDLENMLRSQLNRRGEKGGLIHVIHRLDQPVEGILVFAKNKKAAASLSEQVQSKGEMSKNYLAVVFGILPDGEKEKALFNYIDRDKQTGSAVIVEEENLTDSAKKAALSYKVLEEITIKREKIVEFKAKETDADGDIEKDKRSISLLEIRLDTGRFHQIRAQLSNMGYPIMGDRRYFTEDSNALSRELMVRNVALCAYKLNFKHPKTGQDMEFKIQPKGEIFRRFRYVNC
ncbi:RluA family pseudouridine synthase [Butyrivibrio sp. NC2002]|uniref:RluA family pseudouridine synthase n=1 Tax=Butyrivibrio sp. NC2002 TaxID=1410610 RepID=UPI00056362A1|nr:RluA family pseudouridine synthase [Butyrivibrio sp. NC2002]